MSFRIEIYCDLGGPGGQKNGDDCLSNRGNSVGVTLWAKEATASALRMAPYMAVRDRYVATPAGLNADDRFRLHAPEFKVEVEVIAAKL